MAIFKHMPHAAILMQPDTLIIRVNKMAERQFGIETLLRQNVNLLFLDLVNDEEKSSFLNYLHTSEADQYRPYSTSLDLSYADHPQVTTKLSLLEDGTFLLLLSKNDLSSTGCATPCFQNQVLNAQYQYNPSGILIVNNKMEMISFNQEYIHMWDISEEIIQSRDEQASLSAVLEKLIDPGKFLEKVNYLYEHPYKSHTDEVKLTDGRVFYRHTYPLFSNSQYLGRVWYFLDITELHAAKEQLEFMAHHDSLTKLPNRRLFHNILKQLISNAERNNSMVGLLFLDLDNFKNVNDLHGHSRGDELLKDLAEAIQADLRESDIVCRWGGDEFVIALPDIHGPEDAELVASKLSDSIHTRYQNTEFGKFNIGASIGIAMFPDHSLRPDRLIRNADQAMYQAKRRGKNQFYHFTPDNLTTDNQA